YISNKLRKTNYWPGIKKTIENVIKECEVCHIYNRKPKRQPECVSTTRPLEKVALDTIELREKNCYIFIKIDYYIKTEKQ
ncbi:hypothetical protein BDAP_000589, partial [Binucleata daphniae]